MKLLWVSNVPEAPSGYGSQTRQVGRRLRAAGHDVVFSANDGNRGLLNWNGAMVLGMGDDRYSRDVLREQFLRFGREWAISLYDAWVYVEGGRPDPFEGLRTAGWFPIDHDPVPIPVAKWARNHLPIAMSRFGQRELAAIPRRLGGPIESLYVPHALEPVFRPTPVGPGFKRPFREVAKVPDDAYLVSIVAANTGTRFFDRKGWSEMFQAFAVFAARHRDVHLYLHTREWGPEGIPLPQMLQALDVPPERVRWADQWSLKLGIINDADMASIYTASDVLLMTSRGEGFGIPAIEAQACGVPVIVSDWTAQAELVGEPWEPGDHGLRRHPSGWSVSVQRIWDYAQASWFGVPNVEQTIDALEDAYAHRGDAEIKAAALAKAADYDADTVFERYWRPVLDIMASELVRPNRAARRKMKAERAA